MATDEPRHVKPEMAVEICWILDVRRYGIEIANTLHQETDIASGYSQGG